MLRLRNHLLSAVRAAWPLLAASSLHRLLLYSTATTSPARFVADDFLVTSCGLTPAQALKAARYLAHLKSPSNPEAVLAFFADSGLAKADVAAAIAKTPRLLCCKVGQTLTPRLGLLRDIGLSPPQISSLIAVAPNALRSAATVPRLAFYIAFLGSYEKVHAVLARSEYFLSQDVERVVKPNIAFLQQIGLTDCDIAKVFCIAPTMLLLEPERVKEIVMWADKLGVPRDSAMFKHAITGYAELMACLNMAVP